MRPEETRAAFTEPHETSALEESAVIATLLVSPRGRILHANDRMCRLLDLSVTDLKVTTLPALLADSGDWSGWQSVAKTGRGTTLTTRLRAAGGETVTLRGDIRIVREAGSRNGCLHGLLVDVSEERHLRNAVQQSARMEALGSLTAGIAHDFNNLLTVLVGNLYLVAEEVRHQPKLFAKLKSARDASKRGADLIRQLLTFARRETLESEVIDPGKVIDALAPLLRRALGSRITFETRLEAGGGLVRASTAQLESVIVNLAMNSRDAITGKGTIVASVAEAELSPDEARQKGVAAGRYVAVGVADDGIGIAPEALERVFEPFYSTKKDRGGTGLGLSMVRWFAEQAGGSVRVDSAHERGTTITLLLPMTADGTLDTTAGTMPLSTLPTGKEKVLVSAGEESLRSTIEQILQVLGYQVQLRADPRLTLAALRDGEFDLLIVDGALWSGSFGELLAEAKRLRPCLKVISTADSSAAAKASSSPSIDGVLLKPFSLADLAGAVRRVLDEHDGAIQAE
jgi:signal transduction histidine kinase